MDVAIPAPGATQLWFCTDMAHPLTHRVGEVFYQFIPGIGEGTPYALRCDLAPGQTLLDPWARALEGPLRATGETRALVQARLPTQPWASMPARPEIIYELHVKGFTAVHPDIPEAIRGTFKGLAHPAAIAHLHRLGITCVELLPVAAWVDERHLLALGLTNYWGYNPVAFLAPDPRLAPGGMAEIRAAVATLRAAGIGVILDVVFNHTGEGDALGPTLSLRGLGEPHWYRIGANDSGCGNVLALDRPWPLRLVMDALRHWAEQAGVDGFRLDLGTTLGRSSANAGFDVNAPLLAAMRQDPVLRTRRIIAEPWDIGTDGYQLGRFPAGWGEWNDRFRDDTRRFWRGDAGLLGPLATRIAGSADVLPGRAADSVNFITAHDGFTLMDLVSHERRHNLANGEDGRDGTGENHSWNHGIEGPAPALRERRLGDMRALLATLLAARGVPMLSMGDEGGRSQGGNNNAYAQDNATSWMDWAGMDAGLVHFTARLIAARRAHPALHATAALDAGHADWRHPEGHALSPQDWAICRALVLVLTEDADRVLIAINAGDTPRALHPPRPRWGFRWRLLADSAAPTSLIVPSDIAPRAVLLLAEHPAPTAGTPPELLETLAIEAGIAPHWHALTGREHEVPEGTLRAVLAALNLPAETAAQARDSLARRRDRPGLPAHLTARAGVPVTLTLGATGNDLTLTLEDGTQRGFTALSGQIILPPLPMGRHELRTRDALCRITAAPETCHIGIISGQRRFGITAQSYALRHVADQGIGDFTAIAELARGAAAAGALWLGISPPHALILTDRERASPYQPSDRRFLEPLLIDVSHMPGGDGFAGLRQRPTVDYAAVWAAKRRVLAAAWARFDARDPAFLAFRAQPGLEDFATFSALAEAGSDRHGLSHAHDSGVAAFRAAHPDAIGFHAWLQFTADRQMAAAASAGAGLYRDLAVGTASDGAEIWCGEMAFLRGLSIGAPPDPLGPFGQVWGVPPPDPVAAEASGHAGFASLIRANMRHAAALRIDHVLGLKRLFLVPDGARAIEGCYLAQPFEAALGEIKLESQLARCAVVGEDLGTVPDGLREALGSAQILSYRVLWFERDGTGFRPPEHYPELAAACVATHDIPTLAGWWSGNDIAERVALGLLDTAAALAARQDRTAERAALLETLEMPHSDAVALPPDIAAAIHAYVAATPSRMMLIQAEDLAGAEIGVNLPGTDRERPNWRHRIIPDGKAVLETPVARAVLSAIAGRRA